jgi:hypothetical protein
MSKGVIYYNRGTACAVRLLVSIYSLRRFYEGPITILADGASSYKICSLIAEELRCDIKLWSSGISTGSNEVYLAKTRYHVGTPYLLTIALDADTVVVAPVDELFDFARSDGFCVARFSNWKTSQFTIAKRIARWKNYLSDDINPALSFGSAINCGVVVFAKDTPLYSDWYKYALLGRNTFIPDEVCCQIILHRYPHRLLDSCWNRSCKYDNPRNPSTKIIHYHGRKHCRKGLPFSGDIWIDLFREVHLQNLARIQEWMPAGDRMLTEFLKANLFGAK